MCFRYSKTWSSHRKLVGVIIGAAFGKIVTSLVEQVVMPPIGLLLGGVDFSNLKWVLAPEDPATEAVEEVATLYGAFINTLIHFVILAFVIFLMVKFINRYAARRRSSLIWSRPRRRRLRRFWLKSVMN